ncbi:MAG: hemerythrin family protein [Treponema sp.]|nr:hemerythrin family protein [Treponema sp.]
MVVKTSFEKPAEFIQWNERYKVGIPVVDAQHESLVNLCNDFYKSILKNGSAEMCRDSVRETLEKCLNYAVTHFQEEERLMQASSYAGFWDHKAAHDAFEKKCRETYGRFSSITVPEALKFAYFLRDWILTHIGHDDRLYLPALVAFLKENHSSQFQK